MFSRTGLRTIACGLPLALTTLAQAGGDEAAQTSRHTTLEEAWNKKPSELAQPPKPVTSTKRMPGSDLRVMPNTTLGAKIDPSQEYYAGVQSRMDAEAKERDRKAAIPLSEVNSALIMSGPIGAVIKNAARPAHEQQPGFKVDWDAARRNTGDKPFTSPEIELISQARSPETQRAREWEVNNNRETADTAASKGELYRAIASWAPIATFVGILAVLLFRRLRR